MEFEDAYRATALYYALAVFKGIHRDGAGLAEIIKDNCG